LDESGFWVNTFDEDYKYAKIESVDKTYSVLFTKEKMKEHVDQSAESSLMFDRNQIQQKGGVNIYISSPVNKCIHW